MHRDNAALYVAAIVESSEDAILGKDLNGTITSWNPAAERMFGYTAAEAIGQSIRLIVPEERYDEEDEVLAKLRRGERVEHFETSRRRKDGGRVPVSLTVSPIRDAEGRVIGASSSARDITAAKEAEARRLDLQRRLELLVQASATAERNASFLAEASAILASSLDYQQTLQGVAKVAVPHVADWCAVDVVAADGTVERLATTHVDPAKVELAKELQRKYPPDPESPYGIHQVIRTKTPVLLPHISEELLASRVRDPEHLRMIRDLGLRSYMSVPLLARGQARGAITFVAAESGRSYTEADLHLAQDIASRAALAIDNAFAYEEARRASRLKDDFLATLSHELRTPLNAILGYARMLRSGLLSVDRQTKALETIDRNARALSQLVEDVLDISRIIAGKIRLHAQPVELPRVISAAVASAHPAADAKGVRLQCLVDPQTPFVSGDPDRLQQVIWNVLSNAVKFTPRGGSVRVVVERTESHVAVQVTDTGVGIQEEFLPFVFERFRQADSRFSREHGGLGLGLAISREIVQMHGGSITAESGGEGKGATFRIELPMMIQPRRDLPAPARPGAAASRPNTLAGVRVLAVDDDEDALTLMSEILEAAGASVETAASADHALQKLRTGVTDVLVSDIGMPRVDGLEFIRQVREDQEHAIRRIPAAALTAYARSDDRTRALDAGFQLHLAKPIDPLELISAVRRLASGSREDG